jgi:2-polyprenyl-3-methyl-5-hydroxy-6-metoxy-1,4-benzoquinol methylase
MPSASLVSPMAAVSPAFFFEHVSGFQRTAVLKTALDLDLFTILADGPQTADALAEQTGAAVRGIRIVSNALVAFGLLVKQGDRYQVTRESGVFLSRRSGAYLGSAAGFFASSWMLDHFAALTSTVQQGSPAHAGVMAADHPIWVEFARAMAPLMAPPAEHIAGLLTDRRDAPLRVLDIAAGHGLFGIAAAVRCPHAIVTGLDWPNVLAVAMENASQHGVEDRYRLLPGNAFDTDFGSGYDVVLLANFLHHFDSPANVALLAKAYAALNAGGRVVVLEFVLDEGGTSPLSAVRASLSMLGTTPSGEAYTLAELRRMLRDGGFVESIVHAVPMTEQLVVLGTKG